MAIVTTASRGSDGMAIVTTANRGCDAAYVGWWLHWFLWRHFLLAFLACSTSSAPRIQLLLYCFLVLQHEVLRHFSAVLDIVCGLFTHKSLFFRHFHRFQA